MKVRVFVPGAGDAAGEPAFSGSDHHFPLLPSVGHVVHFRHAAGDFTVQSVGFVQDEDAFLPAVWLELNRTQSAYVPEARNTPPQSDPSRDLNHDIPPEVMTDY